MNTWDPYSPSAFPTWGSLFRLPVAMEEQLDVLYARAKALELCGTRQEFLCCLGELYGLRAGLALSPSHITESLLRLAERALNEYAQEKEHVQHQRHHSQHHQQGDTPR